MKQSFCWLPMVLVVAFAGSARSQGGDITDVSLGFLNDLYQPSGSHTGTWPNGTAGLTMATTSCNIGDVDVPWWSIYGDGDNSPKWECPRDPREVPNSISGCHPSIGMEMYRLRDGRLDQIGLSWLKHGWYALSSSQCTQCVNGDPSGNHLGVGCSDTYSRGNNAARDDLGPRSEWNPYTNVWEPCGSHFDGPNNDCKRSSHSHGPVDHRVRVGDADLNVPDADFFYQSVYYVEHEALLWDNIGWQPVSSVSWNGSKWVFGLSHPNRPTWQPIIQMWDPDAVELDTGEGLAYAGVQVTQVDESTWHYEYGVYNFTSNIPFWSFSVPMPADAVVTDIGFHDIDDPEEPWSMDDWEVVQANGRLTWFGQRFDDNPDANALRYGRHYSFWFTADVPPVPGQAALGLFQAGPDEEILADLEVPEASVTLLPEQITIIRGRLASGELSDTYTSDDSYMVFQPGITKSPDEPPVWLILDGTSVTENPVAMRFILETAVSTPGVTQTVELFNFDLGAFEVVDQRVTTMNDSVADIVIDGDPSRFVEAETRAVQAQLTWMPPPLVLAFPWNVNIDQSVWSVTP